MTNQRPQGNDERRRLENDIFELRPELKTAVRQIRDQLAALENRPGSSVARFEQSLGNSRNRANTNGEINRQSAHDRNGEQIPRGEARAMPCPAAQRGQSLPPMAISLLRDSHRTTELTRGVEHCHC